MKARKAQASIIVIILIILIVLVAIAIFWNVVITLIRERGEEVEISRLTTSLEIKEVIVFENQVSHVTVNRKIGGELDGLRFVFYDVNSISKIKDKEGLEELETRTYHFSHFEGLGKLDRVSVAPILNNRLGMESETQTSKIFEIPSGVVIWKKFDESGNLINDYFEDSLNFEDQIAVSFWVQNTGSVSGENYRISYANNNVSFSFNNEAFEFENLDVNDWNHIVVSIDASAHSKVYINTNVETFDVVSNLNINNKTITFSENVNEIIVFNKALFSTDVEGLFDNQIK